MEEVSSPKYTPSFDSVAVPITVWENIFEQYCADSRVVLINWDSTGPWLLSHVCHAWRSIVLSTPSLWSSVIIRCYTLYLYAPKWRSRHQILNSAKYHEAVQERFRCQLLRSKRVPLHVTCTGGLVPGPHDVAMLPLWRLLINESDRWQFVVFDNLPHDLFRDISIQERLSWSKERQKNPFPALHFLDLVGNTELCDLFDYPAPKLRSISISANGSTSRVTVAELKPLGQVTECHISSGVAEFAVPVLVRIKDTVEDLSVLEITSRESWTLEGGPEANQGSFIRFERLRRLRLRVISKPRGVLQLITTPVLEDLCIDITMEGIIRNLMDMVLTSDCLKTLKRLKMTLVLKQDHIVALLQLLPSLESLALAFIELPTTPTRTFEHIVDALGNYTRATDDTGTKIVLKACPRLKNLSLHWQSISQHSRLNLGRLAAMISLRRNATAESISLERLILRDMPGWSDEGVGEGRLRELEREGLRLEVLEGPGSP